jgi:hypothetical protein
LDREPGHFCKMSLIKEENTVQNSSEQKEEGAASESDNSLESSKEEYDQLCNELNMDESTMEAAWKSYIAIKHNYTLEVGQCLFLDTTAVTSRSLLC